MRNFIQELKSFFRKGDMILLMLCLATSAFGCLILASATNAPKFGSSTRYIVIQIGATLIGVLFFWLISSIDVDFFSEHRIAMTVCNVLLLLMLIPFGTDSGTGNRSWLHFSFLPFNIQPAELCKILYIVVMASVMNSHQNRLSHVGSVVHMVVHLVLVFGVNMIVSRDLGVSLIFVFIFIGMVFAGGVKMIWFLIAGGGIAVAAPILWTQFLSEKQRLRILVLFDPTIDPQGLKERWHSAQSLKSLTGGGLVGQGLFNGNRTQAGALYAQHTDYIFSSIGEELGFLGCLLVIAMLLLIIIRCIWVGCQTRDYMRRVVCFGAAAALIFQIVSNIGMCLGVTPVIGLTLPLFSYGGSSIVTTYAMLGLVSGIHARPAPKSHERYIQPPR